MAAQPATPRVQATQGSPAESPVASPSSDRHNHVGKLHELCTRRGWDVESTRNCSGAGTCACMCPRCSLPSCAHATSTRACKYASRHTGMMHTRHWGWEGPAARRAPRQLGACRAGRSHAHAHECAQLGCAWNISTHNPTAPAALLHDCCTCYIPAVPRSARATQLYLLHARCMRAAGPKNAPTFTQHWTVTCEPYGRLAASAEGPNAMAAKQVRQSMHTISLHACH